MRLGTSVFGMAIVAAVALAPAAAEVIAIDDSGASRIYCTAGQNGADSGAGAGRSAASSRLQPLFERMGRRYGISPDLLDVLAHQESNYEPRAVSPKGAIGIMQLMPATARALGVDPYDTEQNVAGGAAYLRYLLDAYDGQIDMALSAYNAGQTAVARYGRIPPFKETRTYLLRSFEGLAKKSDRLSPISTAERRAGYIHLCRQ